MRSDAVTNVAGRENADTSVLNTVTMAPLLINFTNFCSKQDCQKCSTVVMVTTTTRFIKVLEVSQSSIAVLRAINLSDSHHRAYLNIY